MCGICGKIYFDRSRSVDQELIERMTSVLEHRGPDDSGVYASGPVGLGHRRLSIIDLTAAGHQPMANEDGSIHIVYNGEIYNFEQLRPELEAKGHVFRSNTDTEVILHLYEEAGPACVERLRGMFAFCIWDSRRRELFLARDRAGKKPLVYAVVDGAFIFASEIKSLLLDPSVDTQLNPEALHHYLTYQYVPGPQTIFKGIYKLPPAHTLVMRNGEVRTDRYWDLGYVPKIEAGGERDYVEKLRHVFKEAVKVRLHSDVPLGAFLSGGIDSSATVAVMSDLVNRPVKTFSIGFEESDFNEVQHARRVADLFKTDHTEFIVKPDALDVLPKILWHYDEPYADPSAIPTYYVSKLTREHVTVALNGDGGDETFGGYERYVANTLAERYTKIPAFLRKGIQGLVDKLPYQDYRWSIIRRLKRFIGGATDDPARRCIQWLCYFNNEMKEQLYTATFAREVAGSDSVSLIADIYNRADADNLIDRTMYADVMLYLPYDLLVKVDIASMAHSLEARSPFLDHHVMEFAAHLPQSLKLKGMQTKYILKKAFEDVLPHDILYRKKMGFGVPLNSWFRNELKEATRDILFDARTLGRGYFRKNAVEQLLSEHNGMQADHSYRLWALLYLELWHRMFVDKSEVLGI